MSTFEVLVRTITSVTDHPKADRLSLVKVLGYECIDAKNPDGSHRQAAGNHVVYIPEAAIVPEDVLRENGFWNEAKGIGILAGKCGDRVKAVRLRGIISQGIIIPLYQNGADPDGQLMLIRNGEPHVVNKGQDVAHILGITKYEPPVPGGLGGEVASAPEFSFSYDIENAQNFPGFLDDDEVEVTEKLHGTNFRVTYHPTARHDDIFGGGCIAIASKGLGEKGLVFKNNRENLGPLWVLTDEDRKADRRAAFRYKWFSRIAGWFGKKIPKPRSYTKSNLYIRVALELGLIDKVRQLGERLNQRVDLFGEIYGAGVQDLTYGTTKAEFRAFDIALDRRFAGTEVKARLFEELDVPRVPVLYRGPWDYDVLVKHRDGKTVVGGNNIREGIVITAVGDQESRQTPDGSRRLRPILKMISPAYLTRGGDATEYT